MYVCRKSSSLAWCITVVLLIVQQWWTWKISRSLVVVVHDDRSHHQLMLKMMINPVAGPMGSSKGNETEFVNRPVPTGSSATRTKTAAYSASKKRRDVANPSTRDDDDDDADLPMLLPEKALSSSSSSFSWDDLDYTIPPDCGKEKCFHRSRHNHSIGYLIAKDTQEPGQWRAWNISQSISALLSTNPPNTSNTTVPATNRQNSPQTKHHFYADSPPILKMVNDQITRRLGALRKGRNKHFFVGTPALVVQEATVAPRGDFKIISCSPARLLSSCKNVMEQLVINNINATDDEKHYIQQTFEESIQNTLRVLQVHPNLVYDFQVFLNSKGEIYHFDLDRGRKAAPLHDIEACRTNLMAYSQLLP